MAHCNVRVGAGTEKRTVVVVTGHYSSVDQCFYPRVCSLDWFVIGQLLLRLWQRHALYCHIFSRNFGNFQNFYYQKMAKNKIIWWILCASSAYSWSKQSFINHPLRVSRSKSCSSVVPNLLIELTDSVLKNHDTASNSLQPFPHNLINNYLRNFLKKYL